MASTDVPSLLAALGSLYTTLPFQYLLIGHCLCVAALCSGLFKDKYLLSYWVGLFAAFGGGILSALLLQDPEKAGIALLTSNAVGVTWTAVWWAINYFPGGVVVKVHSLLPIRAATKACLNVLRVGLTVSRIDLSVVKYPGVYAAPIVIGVISASGGKLLVDAVLAGSGRMTGPAEVSEPTFPLRSGVCATLAYYLPVHVLGYLTPLEGLGLVTSVLILHGFLSDMAGRPLDFTAPLFRVLHTATLVPPPGAQLQPRPSAGSTFKQPAAVSAGESKKAK